MMDKEDKKRLLDRLQKEFDEHWAIAKKHNKEGYPLPEQFEIGFGTGLVIAMQMIKHFRNIKSKKSI